MTLARDVTDHLEAIGQAYLGDLAQGRVRLLRRRRIDARANAALLRRMLQGRHVFFARYLTRGLRMSWLIVGILYFRLRFSTKRADALCIVAGAHLQARERLFRPSRREHGPCATTFAQNQTAPSAVQRRKGAWPSQRTAMLSRSCPRHLTFRSQRQRLSFLRRGVTPRAKSQESYHFQRLKWDPGRPFRTSEAHRLP